MLQLHRQLSSLGTISGQSWKFYIERKRLKRSHLRLFGDCGCVISLRTSRKELCPAQPWGRILEDPGSKSKRSLWLPTSRELGQCPLTSGRQSVPVYHYLQGDVRNAGHTRQSPNRKRAPLPQNRCLCRATTFTIAEVEKGSVSKGVNNTERTCYLQPRPWPGEGRRTNNKIREQDRMCSHLSI